MKLLIISDSYLPSVTSCAVQINDLAIEMQDLSVDVTLLYPDPLLNEPFYIKSNKKIKSIALKTNKIKGISYALRFINELTMPFRMYFNYRKTKDFNAMYDGIIWYSPSIFFGPLVYLLKRKYNCSSYLILRDIAPDWFVDLGIIKKGLPYFFMKLMEFIQYIQADTIGVQAKSNIHKLSKWKSKKIEVLENWLRKQENSGCSISLENTPLSGRKIFIYAGTMGAGQGLALDALLNLCEIQQYDKSIGFVFVGNGTKLAAMKEQAAKRGVFNVLFFDSISPSEIPGLYSQCHIGLVALDSRHKTNNIPGKFISYIHNGLPVFALVNPGNELIEIVSENNIGIAISDHSIHEMQNSIEELKLKIEKDNISLRCLNVAEKVFSSRKAANQILKTFNK